MRLCARSVGTDICATPAGAAATRDDGDSLDCNPGEANAGSREAPTRRLCRVDRNGSKRDLATASRDRQAAARRKLALDRTASAGQGRAAERMMREIVLDTETTGLDAGEGHR